MRRQQYLFSPIVSMASLNVLVSAFHPDALAAVWELCAPVRHGLAIFSDRPNQFDVFFVEVGNDLEFGFVSATGPNRLNRA
jgi:hypothetical protein